MYSSLGTDYLSGSDSILSEPDGYLRGHSITMWTKKRGGGHYKLFKGPRDKGAKCPFLSTRKAWGSKFGKMGST